MFCVSSPVSRAWVLLTVVLAVPAGARATDGPVANAIRVEVPPQIDGDLSDTSWLTAPAITGFRQREPAEGSAASEPTTVYIVYDEAHLYIGAMLLDSGPEGILATELRRDDSFDSDDTFAVLLDTYHDGRNAFLFRVNPNGGRFDAVIRNESVVDSDWDERWTAAASIGARGWSVEIAIPFSTLRFPRGRPTWGLNFERVIRRKNEDTYWTNWDRDFRFEHVSQAGALTGLDGVTQRGRVRVRPYVVAGADRLAAQEVPSGARPIGHIGLDDVKIAVTPSLTADIAVYPDFAQTEIDEQRVNLTRFSLFFPEKRQFFIEGAESLRMRPPIGEWDDEVLELFHSRRIGLSPDGQSIPLVAGGKLTGKTGRVDVGLLGARTGGDHGRAGEGFGVARVRRELLGRSYVGAIATTRHGTGGIDTTIGADARLVLKQHLQLTALAARAASAAGEAQWARHAGARWDDDLFGINLAHLGIDPGFDPALGYVRRRDRSTEAAFVIKPRPSGGPVRQFEAGSSLVLHHDRRGALVTGELTFDVETNFQSGDELEVSLERNREVLREPFEIGGGVVLPAARYDFGSAEVTFRSFDGRPIRGSAGLERGRFYNGHRTQLQLSLALRLGSRVRLQPEYEMNDITLPAGAFTTHLGGARADVAFGLNWLTSVFVQYNSEGNLSSIQARLDHIFRSIDHFYVVFSQTRFTGGAFAGSANRSLVAKVTYSWQP